MRVIVVGGGISGLTAGYRLKKLGHEVSILEGGERVGGLLGTEKRDGYVIEIGPDSILTEKPWAMALAEELGLASHIVKTNDSPRGAYLVHQGRLVRVPEGFSLMAPTDIPEMVRSPILSWGGKLRMLFDLVLPRGDADADESLEKFVTRRFGHEAFERMAQPLVGGIYGADPALLSLRATMPRFPELEKKHRSVIRGLVARQKGAIEKGSGKASGARYGLFAAFDGGMQTLIDALENALALEIEKKAQVTSIERDGKGFRVEVRGRFRSADAVIVAVPAYIASQLTTGLDQELARELEGIPYGSAATVTVAYSRSAIPHPLDAFGFVVPSIEGRNIIASTWASVKWPGRAPKDKALIRVFIGGYKGQHLVEQNDEELLAITLRELRELIGVTSAPEFTRVARYVRAMPQYHVGHLERVARIEARERSLANFALAGNAYRGVGIPDAVKSDEDAVSRIVGASTSSTLQMHA